MDSTSRITGYNFFNNENHAIYAEISDAQLHKVQFKMNKEIIPLDTVRFSWSCSPEEETDEAHQLLFRELTFMLGQSSNSHCNSFKFFYREIEEQSLEHPKTLERISVVIINFGNPEGQWLSKWGTAALTAGTIGMAIVGAPAVATGVAMTSAMTLYGYAKKDQAYYSHSECGRASVKSVAVSIFSGCLGKVISTVSAVGNFATQVSQKLPVNPKTITNVVTAMGVSGTCATMGAISDFLNGKPARLSQVAIAMLTSMVGAGVTGPLGRAMKQPDFLPFDKVILKGVAAATGGAAATLTGNYCVGKPLQSDLMESALMAGGSAAFQKAAKEYHKVPSSPVSSTDNPEAKNPESTSSATTPTSQTTPVSQPQTLTKDQHWQQRIDKIANDYNSSIDDAIKYKYKFNGHRVTESDRQAILDKLFTGAKVTLKGKDGWVMRIGKDGSAKDWTKFLEAHNKLPDTISTPIVTENITPTNPQSPQATSKSNSEKMAKPNSQTDLETRFLPLYTANNNPNGQNASRFPDEESEQAFSLQSSSSSSSEEPEQHFSEQVQDENVFTLENEGTEHVVREYSSSSSGSTESETAISEDISALTNEVPNQVIDERRKKRAEILTNLENKKRSIMSRLENYNSHLQACRRGMEKVGLSKISRRSLIEREKFLLGAIEKLHQELLTAKRFMEIVNQQAGAPGRFN